MSNTDWQFIKRVPDLLARLDLTVEDLPGYQRAGALFPLRVSESFVKKMRPSDPQDPLLQQVLPHPQETVDVAGYVAHPLQETDYQPAPRVLHKYAGRVLLLMTGACPIHCRFCFRRHFPYAAARASAAGWEPALQYIQQDTRIHEVILSGGEPLLAKTPVLAALTQAIAAIEHVKTLRIHTRVPSVLPERMDSDLIKFLTTIPLNTVLVLHCNHPNEIDHRMADILLDLSRQANVHLLGQMVLLKGINDAVHTLEALCLRLFQVGVLPYYLHCLDRVQGAAHFEVPLTVAKTLMGALLGRLPGYLVPRLVRELPGRNSKTVVCVSDSTKKE